MFVDLTPNASCAVTRSELMLYHSVVCRSVVGASLDYEAMSQGMLWVNLSGTAVRTRAA